MSKRFGLVAGAVLVIAVAVLFGGVMGPSARQAPASVAPEAPAVREAAPRGTGRSVAELERRVAQSPTDGSSLVELGLAYQQAARETADPSYYSRSEHALRRALAVGGDEYTALTGLASLAASRHEFHDALTLARRAKRLRPDAAPAYGILGDALVELGRYDDGFAAFRRMAALETSLASQARISYLRELKGKTEAAVVAMRRAVEAGSTSAENTAWAVVQLGNLYFGGGRLEEAARAYEIARAVEPGYVHARAGTARVEAARDRLRRAVALYRRVADEAPLPEYAIALGDVLAAADREREARQAYALVGAIDRVLRGNGVRTELETALFDLDHGRDVADALARAREAYERAPSIYAEDVLAWALYKNGRCAEARAHSVRALRLGTRDALMHFHRGMIERCLSDREAARSHLGRALAINPHFSLVYAPIARRLLR